MRLNSPGVSFLQAQSMTCNAPCWQITHLHRLCSLWRYTDKYGDQNVNLWDVCFMLIFGEKSNYELYEYIIAQYFDIYVCVFFIIIPQYLTEIHMYIYIHMHLFSQIPLFEDMLCSWSIHICVSYSTPHPYYTSNIFFCDEALCPMQVVNSMCIPVSNRSKFVQ